jgi:hypothetical protein
MIKFIANPFPGQVAAPRGAQYRRAGLLYHDGLTDNRIKEVDPRSGPPDWISLP